MMEWAQSTVLGIPLVLYVGGAFLLLALCLGIKPIPALKNALMIASGLISVFLLSNFMFAAAAPVTAGIRTTGIVDNDILCTGMCTWFSAMVSLPFFIGVYLVGMLTNYLLLRVGFTKTVDIDFINYFCFLTPAIPVWLHTGNLLLCALIFIFFMALNLKVADWAAPKVQAFYEMDGISIMHHSAGLQAVYCVAVNWLLDRIPGVNRIDFTLDNMQQKLGVFSEPAVLCLITGLVMGLLGGLKITETLLFAFAMVAAALLFPKAIGIFMEGLSPITKRMREIMAGKLHTEDVYMGMDAAVLTGDPQVVSITALWVPIYVALHFLLPWSRIVPGPESFSISMTVAMCLPFAGGKDRKGNVFRTLVMLTIFTCVLMFTAGYVAPYVTALYRSTGALAIPGDGLVTTSGAYHAYNALSYYLFQCLGIA